MKKLILPLVAISASISLAACKQKVEEVDSRAPDPMASQLANAAPVELPPAVKATVSFRCKDNSLAYVDFFQGDKLAHLRLKEGETPITLKAEKAGDPLVGDGYTITGDPKAITLTRPGKGELTCKA